MIVPRAAAALVLLSTAVSCGGPARERASTIMPVVSDLASNVGYVFQRSDVVSAGGGTGTLVLEGRCLVFRSGAERYSPVFVLRAGASPKAVRIDRAAVAFGGGTYSYGQLYRFDGLILDSGPETRDGCPEEKAWISQIAPL